MFKTEDRDRQTSDAAHAEPTHAGPAPSTVSGAIVQRKLARRAAQRKASGGAAVASQLAAGKGAGAALPDNVQQKMGNAFGADFSGVRVHQGDHVSSLGATAYAQGEDVHFAPGAYDPHGASGQELLGHELTHVVQQRAGRVSAPQGKGGLPINSDASLEAEADRLGAQAARGERVSVPGASSSGRAAGGVMQGYFKANEEEMSKVLAEDTHFIASETGVDEANPKSFTGSDGKVNVKEAKAKIPPLRISDDGEMAIEDSDLSSRQPKVFFLEAGLVGTSNEQLAKVGSGYELDADGSKLDVTDKKGTVHHLVGVLGKNRGKDKKGSTIEGPVRCNEMAGTVTGQADNLMDVKTNTKEAPKINSQDFGPQMAKYITEYGAKTDEVMKKDDKRWFDFMKDGEKGQRKKAETAAQGAASGVKYSQKPNKKSVPVVEVIVAEDKERDFSGKLGNATRFGVGIEKEAAKDGRVKMKLVFKNGDGDKEKLAQDDIASLIVSRKDLPDREIDGPLMSDMDDVQNDIASKYANMDPTSRARAEERLGVNDYASPDVGEAFKITPVGAPDDQKKIHDHKSGKGIEAGFPYHWGGVVAKSGGDVVTLENYARNDEDGNKQGGSDDNRAFFQMYGGKSSPNPESKTFHEFWSQFFANPVTTAHKNNGKK